jgi:hypothetical protein
MCFPSADLSQLQGHTRHARKGKNVCTQGAAAKHQAQIGDRSRWTSASGPPSVHVLPSRRQLVPGVFRWPDRVAFMGGVRQGVYTNSRGAGEPTIVFADARRFLSASRFGVPELLGATARRWVSCYGGINTLSTAKRTTVVRYRSLDGARGDKQVFPVHTKAVVASVRSPC